MFSSLAIKTRLEGFKITEPYLHLIEGHSSKAHFVLIPVSKLFYLFVYDSLSP